MFSEHCSPFLAWHRSAKKTNSLSNYHSLHFGISFKLKNLISHAQFSEKELSTLLRLSEKVELRLLTLLENLRLQVGFVDLPKEFEPK